MTSQVNPRQTDSAVKCLICNEMIDLGINYKVGKFVTCKNCESVYEIINIDPVMIDWPYYDDGDEDFYDDFDNEQYD
ncbi:MAG: hypothetical protein ACWGN2_09510 [Anaerolineales bacterium]|jgi:transcription elongation factor Elf1